MMKLKDAILWLQHHDRESHWHQCKSKKELKEKLRFSIEYSIKEEGNQQYIYFLIGIYRSLGGKINY